MKMKFFFCSPCWKFAKSNTSFFNILIYLYLFKVFSVIQSSVFPLDETTLRAITAHVPEQTKVGLRLISQVMTIVLKCSKPLKPYKLILFSSKKCTLFNSVVHKKCWNSKRTVVVTWCGL